jgi:hypothetical protein
MINLHANSYSNISKGSKVPVQLPHSAIGHFATLKNFSQMAAAIQKAVVQREDKGAPLKECKRSHRTRLKANLQNR